MKVKSNKDIQRERTMKLFIDSAYEIIKAEGVKNLSIRKVADSAGYNSATIYNYFENLEHLLYYAYMKKIDSFYSTLYSSQGESKPIEVLRINWMKIGDLLYYYPHEVSILLYSEFNTQYQFILKDYLEIYSKTIDGKDARNIMTVIGDGLMKQLSISIKSFSEAFTLSSNKVKELELNIETFLRGITNRQNSCDRIDVYDDFIVYALTRFDYSKPQKIEMTLFITEFSMISEKSL